MGPLGIDDWRFENSPDGVDIAAAGVWLKPRDLARMPAMVLEGGRWDGTQLVEEQWLRRSTAETTGPSHQELEREDWGYGYYWWTFPGSGAVAAEGHGGQSATVVSWANSAVVVTADPYASGEVAMQLPDPIDLIKDLFGPAP